jgi:hypothetical protein
VIGVERNQHRARLGHHVGVPRECSRAEQRVVRPGPGHVLARTDGDLDDAVRVGELEPAQRGVSVSEEVTLTAAYA